MVSRSNFRDNTNLAFFSYLPLGWAPNCRGNVFFTWLTGVLVTITDASVQRFSENAVSCLIMGNKPGPGLLFELPDDHLDLRIQTMSCEHLKNKVVFWVLILILL